MCSISWKEGSASTKKWTSATWSDMLGFCATSCELFSTKISAFCSSSKPLNSSHPQTMRANQQRTSERSRTKSWSCSATLNRSRKSHSVRWTFACLRFLASKTRSRFWLRSEQSSCLTRRKWRDGHELTEVLWVSLATINIRQVQSMCWGLASTSQLRQRR